MYIYIYTCVYYVCNIDVYITFQQTMSKHLWRPGDGPHFSSPAVLTAFHWTGLRWRRIQESVAIINLSCLQRTAGVEPESKMTYVWHGEVAILWRYRNVMLRWFQIFTSLQHTVCGHGDGTNAVVTVWLLSLCTRGCDSIRISLWSTLIIFDIWMIMDYIWFTWTLYGWYR